MAKVSDLKAQAREFERQGEHEKALLIYRHILKHLEGKPAIQKEIPLYVKAGDLLAKTGQGGEAAAMYLAAADHLVDQGAGERVAGLCVKVFRADPSRFEIFHDYARRLRNAGSTGAARAVLLEYARALRLTRLLKRLEGVAGGELRAVVDLALATAVGQDLPSPVDAAPAADADEDDAAPDLGGHLINLGPDEEPAPTAADEDEPLQIVSSVDDAEHRRSVMLDAPAIPPEDPAEPVEDGEDATDEPGADDEEAPDLEPMLEEEAESPVAAVWPEPVAAAPEPEPEPEPELEPEPEPEPEPRQSWTPPPPAATPRDAAAVEPAAPWEPEEPSEPEPAGVDPALAQPADSYLQTDATIAPPTDEELRASRAMRAPEPEPEPAPVYAEQTPRPSSEPWERRRVLGAPEEKRGVPVWIWGVGGAVVLAGIGAAVMLGGGGENGGDPDPAAPPPAAVPAPAPVRTPDSVRDTLTVAFGDTALPAPGAPGAGRPAGRTSDSGSAAWADSVARAAAAAAAAGQVAQAQRAGRAVPDSLPQITPPVPTPQAPVDSVVVPPPPRVRLPPGTNVSGAVIAVDGLAVESVSEISAEGQSGVRVIQRLATGERLSITTVRFAAAGGDTVGISAPRILTVADTAFGMVRMEAFMVNAQAPITPEALRQLLRRLVIVSRGR